MPVEKIVEVPVEHVVEKIVEVPVERIIEKLVKVMVPVPGPPHENIIYRFAPGFVHGKRASGDDRDVHSTSGCRAAGGAVGGYGECRATPGNGS